MRSKSALNTIWIRSDCAMNALWMRSKWILGTLSMRSFTYEACAFIKCEFWSTRSFKNLKKWIDFFHVFLQQKGSSVTVSSEGHQQTFSNFQAESKAASSTSTFASSATSNFAASKFYGGKNWNWNFLVSSPTFQFWFEVMFALWPNSKNCRTLMLDFAVQTLSIFSTKQSLFSVHNFISEFLKKILLLCRCS